ncbi:hypothetical protein MP638_005772, partial [Amoeboaphelidium occidentale]
MTTGILKTVEIHDYTSNALILKDEFLFSGNDDNSITKFDAQTLEFISFTEAHAGPVTLLESYGEILISGSQDSTLKLWNTFDMSLISHLKRDSSRLGHLGAISAAFVEADSLFSGSADTSVKKWDLLTGKLTYTYFGHKRKVTSISFYNTTLFSAAEDDVIQIFNVYVAPAKTLSPSTATLTRIFPTRVPPAQPSKAHEAVTPSLAL